MWIEESSKVDEQDTVSFGTSEGTAHKSRRMEGKTTGGKGKSRDAVKYRELQAVHLFLKEASTDEYKTEGGLHVEPHQWIPTWGYGRCDLLSDI